MNDDTSALPSTFAALLRNLHTIVRYFASGFITIASALILDSNGTIIEYIQKNMQSTLVVAAFPLLLGVFLYSIIIGVFHPLLIKPVRLLAFWGLGIPTRLTRNYSEYVLMKTRSRRRRGLPDLRNPPTNEESDPWLCEFQRNLDFRWSCMYLLFCSGLGIILSCAFMYTSGRISEESIKLLCLVFGLGGVVCIGGFVSAWHVMRLEIIHLREQYEQLEEHRNEEPVEPDD